MYFKTGNSAYGKLDTHTQTYIYIYIYIYI